MERSRVADILMEQGSNTARALREQGQISADLWSRLGQIPGQAINQYQQQKQQSLENQDRQQRLGIQAGYLDVQQQDRAAAAAEREQQRAGDTFQSQSIKRNTKIDPETGLHTTDHNAVVQELLENNFLKHAEHYTSFAPKHQQMTNDLQADYLALEDKKNKWRLNLFGDIPNAPAEQRADLYTKRLATLPEIAKNDPRIKALPPVYPGDDAMQQTVESFRTDADRTDRQKTAASQALALAKEAEAERRAAATETETAQRDRERAAAVTATAAERATRDASTAAYQQDRLAQGGGRVAARGGGGRSASAVTDVKEAVSAMKDGTAPPMLPGRATKEYLATIAEAHRQKFDIAGAATDWTATQKHISTMNGAQQLRLNQAINSLPEMLDKVDALASKWKGGRFPILNKANLALAKGGAYGQEVASVANQLDAQIADVTADLGNVYMGGNSPTDHALGLAAKSLSGDWSEKVLHDMTALARNNVKIRSNSIKQTGVAGASATNPYGTQSPTSASSSVPANVAKALHGAAPGRHTLSDGSVWMIDASGAVTK